jgi:hypothetical protein
MHQVFEDNSIIRNLKPLYDVSLHVSGHVYASIIVLN